jgi:hypothetical protein
MDHPGCLNASSTVFEAVDDFARLTIGRRSITLRGLLNKIIRMEICTFHIEESWFWKNASQT